MAGIAIREVTFDLPFLGRKCLKLAPAVNQGSHVTVLIGRNGSGKSTLLRDLTVAMRGYYSGRKRASRDTSGIVRIVIDSNGYTDVLDRNLNNKLFDERSLVTGRGPGPNKVIALSFTPFDRFPAPTLGHWRKARDGDETTDSYVYLGFKGGLRASPRALLRRSIDQLALATSGPAPNHHVSDILGVLGYLPSLTIRYQLNRLEKVLASDNIDRNHIEALLKQVEHELRVQRGASGRTLSYEFDFSSGASRLTNAVEFDTLRQLVSANVLQMTAATLYRHDNMQVELLDLSSGELNLLSGFLGLAANLEDGCVVLIDEPENSLHPEWQLRYVEMLSAVLRSRNGVHCIIATHSPLLVSGFAGEDCSVLRLDKSPVEVEEKLIADSSPDATLISAFSIVTPDNSFIKQLLLEAVSLIEQGEHRSKRARSIASFLSTFSEKIPDGKLRELAVSTSESILES